MKIYAKYATLLLFALVLLFQVSGASSTSIDESNSDSFDFKHGNSAVEVIIPTVAPVIFQAVSPTGGDAPLIFRYTMLITNAWFDALALYPPTAVGIYADLGHRPPADSINNRNINIAMSYSSYRVLLSLSSAYEETWRAVLAGVGLDPDNNSTNLRTPDRYRQRCRECCRRQ